MTSRDFTILSSNETIFIQFILVRYTNWTASHDLQDPPEGITSELIECRRRRRRGRHAANAADAAATVLGSSRSNAAATAAKEVTKLLPLLLHREEEDNFREPGSQFPGPEKQGCRL